jgi:hypothetical protein
MTVPTAIRLAASGGPGEDDPEQKLMSFTLRKHSNTVLIASSVVRQRQAAKNTHG